MTQTAQRCPHAAMVERSIREPLSDPDQAALAEHLEMCPDCRSAALSDQRQAGLQAEIRRAVAIRQEAVVDVRVPQARLSAQLPQFEVLEELGRGGMGVVFKARQLSLDRIVAIKVLPALLGAVQPDTLVRFRREARLAATLDHTNIIGVFEFGELDSTLYYVMQYVAGPSLGEILREIRETGSIDRVVGAGGPSDTHSSVPGAPGSGSPSVGAKSEVGSVKGEEGTILPSSITPRASSLPPRALTPSTSLGVESVKDGSATQIPESNITRIGASSAVDRAYYRQVARWIADVADGLHHAHEQGVIHRDIKPSNLLLSHTGRLMISDFGLARQGDAETPTLTRSLVGTARYMAPEQVDERGLQLDRRVDVYALGATLYELLAFRPMFAAADDRVILDCVLNKEPTPPRQFVRQVPRELETICLVAVTKEREKRYATAKALRDDLERWLLDLPIHARRPSLPRRVVKFVRRRKLPVALAATSIVLLSASVAIYAAYRTSHREAIEAQIVARSHRVQVLLLEARSDFLEGRYEAGLARVDEALTCQPGLVEARLLRAQFLSHLRRQTEEMAILDGIVAEEPENWAVHYALVLAHKKSDPEEAAYHEQQVERLMPETAQAYLVRSLVEPNPLRAIELLGRAIDLDSRSIDGFVQRAIRYSQVQQHGAMLADAEHAAILRPDWAIPHGLRGRALLMLYRYEEAAQAFSRAIELEPKRAQWGFRRALAYEFAGCEALALADYDRIAAMGGSAQAYAALAKYILLRQSGQERASAEILASLAPGAGGEVWTDRLFALFTGSLSAKQLLAAAANNNERAEAYFYIGRQALLDGRLDDAKEALTKCVTLDRGDVIETDFAQALLKQLEKHRPLPEDAP